MFFRQSMNMCSTKSNNPNSSGAIQKNPVYSCGDTICIIEQKIANTNALPMA